MKKRNILEELGLRINQDKAGSLLFLLIGTMLLMPWASPSAVAASTGGTLYETFGDNPTIAALSLSNGGGIASLAVPATNIVYANGTVYFESGNTIFSTSPTLVGLNTFHVNGDAPTGLAVDPVDNILYETFGDNGIASLSLSNGLGIGFLGEPATNIVYANGTVYFESGNTILSTTPTLFGANTFHVNNAAPTGLAIMPAPSIAVPEPFNIIGTLIGSAAAFGLKKKLKFTNKL